MEACQLAQSATELFCPEPSQKSFFPEFKAPSLRNWTRTNPKLVSQLPAPPKSDPARSFATSTTATTATETASIISTPATSVLSLSKIFTVQKLHVASSMPIADEIRVVWTSQIKARLSAVLQRSIPSGTCVQEFLMTERRPDAWKPTVVITCGDPKVKKAVEKTFKSQGWLQELLKTHHIMFIALVVTEVSESAGPALNEGSTLWCNDAYAVQLLPSGVATSCGLEVIVLGDDRQRHQKCTLGGLLIVNGELRGLTAGHPFHKVEQNARGRPHFDSDQDGEYAEDDDCSATSSEPFVFNDDDTDVTNEYSSASSNVSLPGKSEVPSRLVDENLQDHYEASDHMRQTELLSTNHHPPHSAIVPVFSTQDDSSTEEGRVDHDWALLDLPSAIKALPNKISHIDERHDIAINGTVSSDASGDVTIAVAGTGPQLGYLHPCPATFMVDGLIRQVQLITLDRVLPLGSSGAWVLLGDKLCGYIIAIRQDVPWAYMTAIEPILNHIRTTLGTEHVRLPSAAEITSLSASPASSGEKSGRGDKRDATASSDAEKRSMLVQGSGEREGLLVQMRGPQIPLSSGALPVELPDPTLNEKDR